MNTRIYIAAAGSRKTTFLVDEALRHKDKRTIIITYTIDNAQTIYNYFIQRVGIVPKNVQICTWYSFLLRQCVRPYQNFVYSEKRIENIYFNQRRSTFYVHKNNIKKYFLNDGRRIYSDKISEFACICNDKSQGLVIKRLKELYDRIYIDEVQDLAGYDFELLELLVSSKIEVTIVGDCRQATYFTNCSPKNKRLRGYSILNLFKSWEKKGLCTVHEKNESFRCNQQICDFADKLYPELRPTVSKNNVITEHDGVFIIKEEDVLQYYSMFHPMVLRDNIRRTTMHLPAINFGVSKGKTFERVMIFPSNPIKKYLEDGNPKNLTPHTKAGFYVAITRAKYSVAIVFEKKSIIENVLEWPND